MAVLGLNDDGTPCSRKESCTQEMKEPLKPLIETVSAIWKGNIPAQMGLH